MTISQKTEATEDLGEQLYRAAGELLVGALTGGDVPEEVRHEKFSPTAWRAAVNAGWFDVLLPESDGGLGLGLSELGGVVRAVGEHLFPGPVADHAAALPLLVGSAPGQARERLLASISGRRTTVLVDGAAADGSAGDRPRLAGARLSGRVDLVRFGALADDLVVVADGGGADPAVVLLSASTDGVSVSEQESIDPVTRYSTVALDAAPVDHPLTAPAQAAATIRHLRADARLLAAAESTGCCRRLLDQSVAYALERQQFGRPIGTFQAIQHLLADLAASVLLLEAATAAALHRVDTEPGQREALSWELKALTSWLGRTVAEGALQVHGGIGFTIEHDVHRGVEHVLALQGLHGDERGLARDLGRALLRGDLEPWT